MKSTLATLALFIAGHALGQTPPITEPAPPPAISDEDTARILAEITKVQKEFAQTKKTSSPAPSPDSKQPLPAMPRPSPFTSPATKW